MPAGGAFRFWQGWLYWFLYLAGVLAITLHFLKHDPALMERRLALGPRAEPRSRQKIIQALMAVFVIALLGVSGFDHRFRWSEVPVPVVLLGDMLVLARFIVLFFVYRENRYASATIEVSTGQRVVSTGPYRLVRHPMYAGASLLIVATPVALGSLVALPLVLPPLGVLVARVLDEERLLIGELPGYSEYCHQVRYRLVPLIW